MLSGGAARHLQVLRLQPGAAITLFDGRGGEWAAVVERIGRSDVQVRVREHLAVEREAAREVHLAVGMPANERMDWLVEKATELGAASIQPLATQRSVLRLSGERAEKKRAHWHAIAVAACEQCGRNRVPTVHTALGFADWLDRTMKKPTDPQAAQQRFVLSLRDGAAPLLRHAASTTRAQEPPPSLLHVLSGPEGGLSAAEEDAALAAGWAAASLGARLLRAEAAALAALVLLQADRDPPAAHLDR